MSSKKFYLARDNVLKECSQRATFTCWSAVTGRHYHNLVTWKDLRADSLVTAWNSSLTMRALRVAGRLLHAITRMPRSAVKCWADLQNCNSRYKAAGILKLYNKVRLMSAFGL